MRMKKDLTITPSTLLKISPLFKDSSRPSDIMGRESTYTYAEREHRIKRCYKLPKKYQKSCLSESKRIL